MRASSGTSWLMIVPNRYSRLLPRLDSTERCSSSCIASRSGSPSDRRGLDQAARRAPPRRSGPGEGRGRGRGRDLGDVERLGREGAGLLHPVLDGLPAGQLACDAPARPGQQPAEPRGGHDGVAGRGDEFARLDRIDAHETAAGLGCAVPMPFAWPSVRDGGTAGSGLVGRCASTVRPCGVGRMRVALRLLGRRRELVGGRALRDRASAVLAHLAHVRIPPPSPCAGPGARRSRRG